MDPSANLMLWGNHTLFQASILIPLDGCALMVDSTGIPVNFYQPCLSTLDRARP